MRHFSQLWNNENVKKKSPYISDHNFVSLASSLDKSITVPSTRVNDTTSPGYGIALDRVLF